VEAARASLRANDVEGAIARLREAIEADPGCIEAHELMLTAANRQVTRAIKHTAPAGERDSAARRAQTETTRKLEALYEAWMQKFPAQAAFPWMLSELAMYRDFAKVESYAKKAVALDPQLSQAWRTLSLIEEARGNDARRLECLKRAVEAQPEEPAWAFYYATANRRSRPEQFVKLASEVAIRFPDHERGAQSLYWLAVEAETPQERLRWLERLRAAFAPERFGWSSAGMEVLFNLYSGHKPQKALELAGDMVKRLGSGPGSDRWLGLL
jgi:tetratricopeptide (TPR) repeat protein